MKTKGNQDALTYTPVGDELRWYSYGYDYVAPELQRLFVCTNSEGYSKEVWCTVDPRNTLIPLKSG